MNAIQFGIRIILYGLGKDSFLEKNGWWVHNNGIPTKWSFDEASSMVRYFNRNRDNAEMRAVVEPFND
jgi:hypothetical protein